MTVVIAGLIAGLVLGVVRGGRLGNARHLRFRWLPAGAVASLGLVLERSAVAESGGIVLSASLLTLAIVAAANLRLAGMGLIAIGLLVTVIPIAANGGQPVDPRALVAVGADPDLLDVHPLAPSQHVANDRTFAGVLGSTIPLPGLGVIVGFGDLIFAVGAACTVGDAMRRRERSGIPVSEILADGPLTLVDAPPLTRLDIESVTLVSGEKSTPQRKATRRQRSVEIGPGSPVPIPLGWAVPDRDDDEQVAVPVGASAIRPSVSHPTMRLVHR